MFKGRISNFLCSTLPKVFQWKREKYHNFYLDKIRYLKTQHFTIMNLYLDQYFLPNNFESCVKSLNKNYWERQKMFVCAMLFEICILILNKVVVKTENVELSVTLTTVKQSELKFF